MAAAEDTAAEDRAEQEVAVHIDIAAGVAIGRRSTAIADSCTLGCTRSENP